MSDDILELVECQLLKPNKYPRVVHKEFLYQYHKACNRHLRWKCNRVYSMKCQAVLRTSMDMLNLQYIAVDHEHNHENDASTIFELKMKIKAVRESTQLKHNSNVAVRQVEDDTRNIDNDSDQNHLDHYDGEPNNMTNDINLVKDNMILIYCKENWTTILNELNDPLKGIKVFESILFNIAYTPMISQSTKTKFHIQKIKGYNRNWKLKFECLQFKIKTLIESTKCDENTRNTSIQNQNQKVMEDLIKDIQPSTTVSILSSGSLKSNKRNLTESDTCITRTKAKIIKTQHSSIPNVDHMDVHISPGTTASRISPKLFYTKQNNLTQSDSGIKMIQSKTIKSNKHYTLVSTNVCPNSQMLTQYDPEIEISEITESNMIDYYEPSIAGYIDLTKDSLPDMRASSINPNILNDQLSLTQCNTQIVSYEPSSLASVDSTVNNLTNMMNSRLSNENNIFTQYNNDIKIISSTSMSTDISSNIPTFSSPSLRAITPNSNPTLFGRPNVEVLVVEKDGQLSTVNANRIKRASWKSPKTLMVVPRDNISIEPERALLPAAIKRALKPNLSSMSKYPRLNKLLTRPTSTIIKPDKINTLNTPANNQMKAPLPPTYTIIELDKRNILNTTPINSNESTITIDQYNYKTR